MSGGGHGDDRACRRAAAALERLAIGEDVALPADVGGDAGRLYDAVRAVADEYESGDDGRERERRHTDRRGQLYDVTSDPSLSSTEKVDRLLELGCEWFGTDNAYLSCIDRDDGRYVVDRAVGDEFVTEGAEVPLSETFCRRAVDDDDILGIYDAVAEGYGDDPGYAHSGIACYLGGRVEVGGDLYGTLCFFDDDPATAPFTDLDRALVDMMVRWVSYELERRERDRDLRLRDRAMAAAPVGITITDATDPETPIVYANERFAAVTGYDAAAIEGEPYDRLYPDDPGEAAARVSAARSAAAPVTETVRAERADGEEFWMRVSLAPVTDDDGVVTHVVTFHEDVTERERRKRGLDQLHDATRQLLTVADEAAAADLVVSATGDSLGDAEASFYRFDADADELRAVAHTDGFAADSPPTFPVSEESAPWSCFVAGEQQSFDDPSEVAADWSPAAAADGGLLVPVGEHGVFVVAAGSVPFDDARRQVVEAAVATAEAAFDRLASEAALRDRERELETRNERLTRQVQMTDIMRTINQSLVAAESREAVETAVCEGLAAADGLAFAWVGSWDAEGGRLDARTWAGDGGGYLDDVSLRADRNEPAVVAARDGDPAVVNAVADHVTTASWAERAAASGFGAAFAVPLAVDEHSHGVLAVCADEPDAFGDLEREVFRELGETIADAIEAVAARRALHADSYVELQLDVEAPDGPLARLADGVEGEVEYEGAGVTGDDDDRLFVTVADADVDAATETLDTLVAVRDYRHVASSADGHAFEVTAASDSVPATLARAGGNPRSAVADGDGLSVVLDVPASVDVREYVGRLRDEWGDVTLVGRRDVERARQTREDVVRELFDSLTDRQLEVLQTAFLAGFFEWPRETTGEGVAEMLDVSQPTVNRHLRVAQRRLLAALFQMEPPSAVSE